MNNKTIAAIIAIVLAFSGASIAAVLAHDNGTDAAADPLDFGTVKIEKGESADVVFKYNKTAYTAYGTPEVKITLATLADQYTISKITEDANGKCKFTITADEDADVEERKDIPFNMNVTITKLMNGSTETSESFPLSSVACKITIQIVNPAGGDLTAPATKNAVVGDIYTSGAFTAPEGVTITSWYAYGLPAGMTISKGGIIVGMPSDIGSYNPKILGITADGATYVVNYPFEVVATENLVLSANVGGTTVGTGEALNLFAETGKTGLDLTVTLAEGTDEKYSVDTAESMVYVYKNGTYTAVALDNVSTIIFDGVGSYFITVDAVINEEVAGLNSYYGHATTQFTVNVLSASTGNVPANITIIPVAA